MIYFVTRHDPETADEEETSLMPNSHFSALETKHAALDRRIEMEAQRPLPDATTIATLKKQKLRLKEELTAL